MPFFVNRGPGLDITAEEAARQRALLLGEDIELQRRNPFLRELQGLGHFMTGGMIPLGKRYEDFPGGRISEEELSPEQRNRLLSMTKAERAMAIGANPTDIFRFPKEYRELLMAPDPEEKLYQLSSGQRLVTGKGEVRAEAKPPMSDLAILNQEFEEGWINREQRDRRESILLKTIPGRMSNVAIWNQERDLGFITDEQHAKLMEGVGKPKISINLAEEQKRASDVRMSIGKIGSLMQEWREMRAKAPRVAGTIGRAAEWLGNFVGMFNEKMAEDVTNAIAGGQVDRAQLTGILIEMRTWAAENIELITGEGGARVSTFEQQRAYRDSKVIGSNVDFTAQQAAMERMAILRILAEETLLRQRREAPRFPTKTENETAESISKLQEMGFPPDTAYRIVERLYRAFRGE